MYKQSLPLFFLAVLGGYLFSISHIPLPWTLGPLVTAVVWKVITKKEVYWPKKLRNTGMVFLGYLLGSPFTPAVAQQVLYQLPLMLAITLVLITLCLGTGYIANRFVGIGTANSVIGSIPGGLSQMSIICEETGGTDVSVVTLMQTVRVITVVFTVPLLALHGLSDKVTAASRLATSISPGEIPALAVFAVTILLLIKLCQRIHLPNTYVIAPILGTACLVLAGVPAPALPVTVIALAQVVIGIRMGIDIDFSSLPNWQKIAASSLVSVLAVILLLLGFAFIISSFYSIPLVTAFISMAPGGMSEMGLIALAANADLPTVVAFQLFRLLFILIVCVPVARWWLHKHSHRCT
ncbi:AbrB family transcriptional regulator [Sporomusa termitida]|uniref:Membrane protein AbrB duplication n=1 Tax=Sporomusa termitida TaxID=2377 RepID=A0A517DRL7_9FIRM|nr:AbrB family transcriptional regulator [Sporomusa termitida]QDR80005.1 membrane protein AbrB duplication [Sporomusa termitida]